MTLRFLRLVGLMVASATAGTVVDADAPVTAPSAVAARTLQRPVDVRELVFLSSGHGMAYGPAAEKAKQGADSPPFTNVFVTPDSYRSFMKSGKWPDGTTFYLEVRQGLTHLDTGTNGSSQGEQVALEAERKDSVNYPDGGFAFFDFGPGGHEGQAWMLPHTAGCYACHSKHGAVEWTFTQFYPEQFAVARRAGTVRKDYDPNIGNR